MQKLYEFLFIVSGEMTDTQVKAVATDVERMFTNINATEVQSHVLGKRRLAYKMERTMRFGTFVMVTAKAEPEAIAIFKEKVRYVKGIVRSSLTVVKATTPVPTFNDREEVRETAETPSEVPAVAEKAVSASKNELDRKIDALLTEEVKPETV